MAEWAGHVKPVRPVPPIQSAAHDDFVAAERERSARMRAADLDNYRSALKAFTDRVSALPELGGRDASQEQFDELDTIQTLLEVALSRRSVLRSRARDGIGLFQQMTGQPLPAYRAAAGSACRAEHRDYAGAGICREETCVAYGMHSATEDEKCTNGEDEQKS